MADKEVAIVIKVEGIDELKFSTTEIERLNQKRVVNRKESIETAKALNAEKGSMAALRAETSLLIQKANQLNTTTVEGAKAFKAYQEQIVKNKEKIRDFDRSLSGSNQLIGEYDKGFTKAFKNIGASLLAVAGFVAGAKIAFDTLVSVFTATGANADKFAATLEGVKQGFDRIKVAIATSNFKDFIKNVKDAIDEGRRYAEGLDEVDDKTRALRIAEAEGRNELLKQREIQNDVRKSLTERNEAGKEAIRIEERLQTIRVSIAKQAYENEITNIASIANGTKNVTEEMRQEILEYVKRSERVEQQLKLASEYEEVQSKIKALRDEEIKGTKTVDNIVIRTIDNSKKILDLNQSITAEQKDAYNYKQRVTIPTDEKYNVLTERLVELKNSEGSAIENTLKIRSKQASVEDQLNKSVEKSADDKNTAKEKSDKEYFEGEMERLKAEEQAISDSIELNEKIYIDSLKFKEEADKEYFAAKMDQLQNEEKAIEEQFEQEQLIIAQKKELKIKVEQETFSQISSTLGSLSSLIESNKQKELSAAGDNAKKREQIEKDYAKKQQSIAIAQTVISGAVAITNALRTVPFIPLGLIAAAGAAAKVGIELAVIKGQKFAKGGYVHGVGTDTSDNIHALLSPGEAVINARSLRSKDTLNLRGTPLEIANALNTYKGTGRALIPSHGNKFALGGMPEQSNAVGVDIKLLAAYIGRTVNDKKVVMQLGTFHDANNNYVQINTANGF